jgi:hypothetical protein
MAGWLIISLACILGSNLKETGLLLNSSFAGTNRCKTKNPQELFPGDR